MQGFVSPCFPLIDVRPSLLSPSFLGDDNFFFLQGYVQKMFKSPVRAGEEGSLPDVWSLITLNCDSGWYESE